MTMRSIRRRLSANDKLGIAVILALNLALAANFFFYTAAPTAQAQQSNFVILGGPFAAMDEQSEQYIKDYLVSVIQNNLTDMSFSLDGDSGRLTVSSNGELPTDYADDISVHIGTSPFSVTRGYEFDQGRITAPNGTQILPRS